MTDTIYVRYVKTVTLSRILESLKNDQLCSFKAKRSFSVESKSRLPDLSYVKIKERKRKRVDIDYNSLNHGTFDKDRVMEILIETGAEEAIVHELDLEIPEEVEVGKLVARLKNDSSFRNLRYVAHFEFYPCRREEEENKFVEEIKNFREDTDMRQGFEPASLDFQYPLWIQIWRDISRMGRRSVIYTQTIEYLKKLNRGNNEYQRKIVKSLFPHGMTSGRMYKRGRGKEKWILTNVGDI